MGLKIQSSTYPAPQTFNEWQAFLKEQRDKYYRAKLRKNENEDLIDIERD